MQQIMIFPTVIFTDTMNIDFSVKDYLNSLEIVESVNDSYGFFSKDTHVLNAPECSSIRDIICEKANHILGNEYCYVLPQGVKITQSWISLKKTSQSHQSHMHSNSVLSGVYYYDDVEYSPIVFYKDHVSCGKLVLEPDIDSKLCENKMITWDKFMYYPKQNDLIFFLSHVKHSVNCNETNSDRKSLAFNIVPAHGFGNPDILTELNII